MSIPNEPAGYTVSEKGVRDVFHAAAMLEP